MKNWGGHFTPELGGHFELESGGHFKLELGGQYHWNLHIGIETYNRMNDKYQSQLRSLKAEQSELKTEKNPIEQYVDGGLALLSNLITIYNKSDYERKRALIGSIFSGKLVVSKTECRTTETNMVIELFTRNDGQLEGIKKGTNSENSGLSPSVLGTGLEPVRPLQSLDFKSSVSTNFTTQAFRLIMLYSNF